MSNPISFIDENQDKFLDELKDFLRFPSVSTKPSHKNHIYDCANWLVNSLKDSGLENATLIETDSNPLVYADWMNAGKNAPTVLIYGHYDVQPEEPLELWTYPPFEPTVVGDKLFGRGTADDKGQVFIHIKAVESLLKTEGKLPVNVKFIIEGEEESGGEAIYKYVSENQEKLQCNAVMISDTEWFKPNLPSITYGLRGIAVVELFVYGPNRDLHSGTYGGGVMNPANALAQILGKMHLSNGKVAIPGFYDNVLTITRNEQREFERLPFDLNYYQKDLDIEQVFGEDGYTTLERVWKRPTLDINGMNSGYIGDGHKSIIPSFASAKISMRLVDNQDPEEIINKFIEYVHSIKPDGVKIKIDNHHGAKPVSVEMDSKAIEAAKSALLQAFGVKSVFMREGGSIPIVLHFKNELKAPIVLMGFGLETDNIHSPNENFSIPNFFGGIKSSVYFFQEFSK